MKDKVNQQQIVANLSRLFNQSDNNIQIIEDFSDELYNYMHLAVIKEHADYIEKIGILFTNSDKNAKYDRTISLSIALANAFNWKFIIIDSEKSISIQEVANEVKRLTD